MKMEKRMNTKAMVLIGMFTAVLAVLAQISIPMPSGVPITLQTFAVALIGYVLGCKRGITSTLIYVLLGTVGVPVFSNFRGGPGVLFDKTGGFIWGFFFLAAFCGIAAAKQNKVIMTTLPLAGLLVCHLFGIVQFVILTGMGFMAAAALVSIPYLLKDIISVFLAFMLAVVLKRALSAANILPKMV